MLHRSTPFELGVNRVRRISPALAQMAQQEPDQPVAALLPRCIC
jgi:hypothetical protein